MWLSKNKLKYIRSLKEKKGRNLHGTFVVEGNKAISDLLPYMQCQLLVATSEFITQSVDIANVEEMLEVSYEELERASFMKTPQHVLAVFYQPKLNDNPVITDKLSLALDGIQDPGNLGTIVRIADWYGIQHVFCSPDSADIYNPKTVQATMGALARVAVHYVDLPLFLNKYAELPLYGTFLDGENMYEHDLTSTGIIVMGNEGNGISHDVEKLVNRKLFIPSYPAGSLTSESLNVGVATAIVCSEFRRRACNSR